MSLKVIKAGILDTIQDMGRYGYQQYGINPGGAMDQFAARMANFLAGNSLNEAVIEMHFPASTFVCTKAGVFVLTGGDFSAFLDEAPVRCNIPFVAKVNSVIRFTQPAKGARCYLAVSGGFELTKWLNSYSTNFKAGIGGFEGRRLLKNDVLVFRRNTIPNLPLRESENSVNTEAYLDTNEILVLPGNEWNWLTQKSQEVFLQEKFSISNNSDRMGYRLTGPALKEKINEQLISTPVCCGTIQLLPDG